MVEHSVARLGDTALVERHLEDPVEVLEDSIGGDYLSFHHGLELFFLDFTSSLCVDLVVCHLK